MIQLQADPLVEWDETVTTMTGQTAEAQAWVSENILNTAPVDTMETVTSVKESADWDRPASQLYTAEGFTLDIVRTYFDTNSSRVQSASYTLATV